jgi:16S rRNA processing protein RimM
VVVAQALAPHGIRGELKCRLITDFPKQRFKRGNTLYIRAEPHTVQTARIQGQTVLLKLTEVADRTTAEAFRGAAIEILADQQGDLPQGEFYWHQVIGLVVEDVSTHEVLGQVRDILETGANDVYVVAADGGREILVPAIKQVVKLIDPAAGRMLVEPMPGMIPR